MRGIMKLSLAVSVACCAMPAAARHIVITNDDGLTSNVVALYHALKEDGHDVIVSVPCTNQSGMGASIRFGQPLGPLDHDCLNEAAVEGDPGAGPMTRADLPQGDFFYVNGTPVMAMLNGVHVVAGERWGAAPDLVLSGPNEGQNLGAIVLSSGTVSAAQFAAVNGLPAMALSAGGETESATLDHPLSVEVARRSAELVSALDEQAGEGAILPQGLVLNVNFPNELDGAEWRLTRIGSYNAYRVIFTSDVSASASPTMQAMAERRGIPLPSLPGLSVDVNRAPPAPGQENDESLVNRQHITISPMQAGYEAAPASEAFVQWQLADLLTAQAEQPED